MHPKRTHVSQTNSLCADDLKLLLAGANLAFEVDAVEGHVVPQRLFLRDVDVRSLEYHVLFNIVDDPLTWCYFFLILLSPSMLMLVCFPPLATGDDPTAIEPAAAEQRHSCWRRPKSTELRAKLQARLSD